MLNMQRQEEQEMSADSLLWMHVKAKYGDYHSQLHHHHHYHYHHHHHKHQKSSTSKKRPTFITLP